MYGLFWDVITEANPINVAYTDLPLPPHQDLWYAFVTADLTLSYYEATPGVQLLHCLITENEGAYNGWIDGIKICEEMKKSHPEEFEILTQTPVTFLRIDKDNYRVTRQVC